MKTSGRFRQGRPAPRGADVLIEGTAQHHDAGRRGQGRRRLRGGVLQRAQKKGAERREGASGEGEHGAGQQPSPGAGEAGEAEGQPGALRENEQVDRMEQDEAGDLRGREEQG